MFRNSYSPVEAIASPVGEPVYNWEFVTPAGEICEESRNVYEMIQSSKQSTLYKEIIDNYGLDSELLGRPGGAIYGDTSQFGSSIDDFGNRVSTLIADLEQAIANAKSGQTIQQAGVQSAQAPAQATAVSGQKTEVVAHA